MKWHKRLKYAICDRICRLCEWVREIAVDEPTYEELEEKIFDLECEVENLKDDIRYYKNAEESRRVEGYPYYLF